MTDDQIDIATRLDSLLSQLGDDARLEARDLVADLVSARGSDAMARLRSIVDTAVDAIVTIDRHGAIVDFNDAAVEMFGYEKSEVIGENVKVLMPGPYREEHDGYLARYLDTRDPHIIGIGREVTGRRKDGSVFPMDLAVSEFRHAEEIHFTGIVRDITERKRMEAEREELIQQLEDKNAELERFTYTVSHDLKSPLITIKGFLGMLESDARSGNTERMRDDIARIGSAADKMKELLDEVLELSRIGRVANPSERVPFGSLVEEVAGLLSGTLDEAGVELVVQDDLPTMYGDRIRLREVVQNLIENAIKFRGDADEPTIEVGATDLEGTTAFFVRDNGVGVEEQYQRKVFGLFDQLDQKREGTGVGLALVKRIIDVHGGDVWLESDGPGTGSTVWFTVANPDSNTQQDAT